MLDPKTFIRLQCVPMFLFGVFFYFGPEHVLSLILNAELDGVHFHMARCTATFCIVLPPMFWYWTKSTDSACNTPTMKCLILFHGFSLMATWYARVFAADFVYTKVMLGMMIFFATALLLNVYLLQRSGWHTGKIEFEADRQFIPNRLFMSDTYGAMFVGSLWMAYPDLLLRRQVHSPVTQHHTYLCRMFGAVLTASNVFGHDAVFFKNSSDRVCALVMRFSATVLVLLSQLHSQYAYGEWWTHWHWVGMSLSMLWIGLAVLCLVNVIRGKWK